MLTDFLSHIAGVNVAQTKKNKTKMVMSKFPQITNNKLVIIITVHCRATQKEQNQQETCFFRSLTTQNKAQEFFLRRFTF